MVGRRVLQLFAREWRSSIGRRAQAWTQLGYNASLSSGHHISGPGDEDPEDNVTTPWGLMVISGNSLLQHGKHNKGMAFSKEEREHLHMRGLVPPAVFTQEVQADKVMINIRNMASDLEKHNYYLAFLKEGNEGLFDCVLTGYHVAFAQDRNERLFYYVLTHNMEELLPVVGMPTVSSYCQTQALMFKPLPRSLWITLEDRGHMRQILKNWPERRVKVICMTDGERVGALGDLGAQSVGGVISKLALYTACGGILPSTCLPVCIDVGTDNEELLNSPFYVGVRHKRVRGEEYKELIDEFLSAVHKRYGNSVVIDFENMNYENLASVTNSYRGTFPCFSDDTQGLGATVLAGILAGSRLTGKQLLDHTFMLVGEGAGVTAVGELIADAIAHITMRDGRTILDARKKLWLVDSKGLVTRSRPDAAQIGDHKIPFLHEGPACPDLLSAVKTIKPTVLIGLSLKEPVPFTREVCEAMAAAHERPIILPLSAPKAEVMPKEAYEWTGGRCLYASRERRTDAPPLQLSDGRVLRPGCVHTAYIFPGVALGTVVSRATRLRDSMFFAAAETLASLVTDVDLQAGSLYPQIGNIREISTKIAFAVAQKAYKDGVATNLPKPLHLDRVIQSALYNPRYRQYR